MPPARAGEGFRPEIEGLRAVAVLPVLLFHFFPAWFPHGFVGVDIFFVISGFLITRQIRERTAAGTFTFRDFYLRRIRRILPATFVMLAATTLVACLVMIPPDLERYGQSLLATLAFVSNIHFWRAGGYFGESDALKPLLHMWSLSVEEQFYLLYPALLVLLAPARRLRLTLAVLAGLSLLSFAGTIALNRMGGENPAFFLLPTRAWHFGLGALAALLYASRRDLPARAGPWIAALLILAGMALPAPGALPAGTLASLGTALLLMRRGSGRDAVTGALGLPGMRWIGRISFSLYLWHWPVIVFLNYATFADPSPLWLAGAILLTFVLAQLSHDLVEAPFRRAARTGTTLAGLGAGLALLAGAAVGIGLTQGLAGRQDPHVVALARASGTNFRCGVNDYFLYGASRACLLNPGGRSPYRMALVGNSHAQMYVPAILPLLEQADERGLLVPLNGCLPTVTANISPSCRAAAARNLEAVLADPAVRRVVFGTTWQAPTLLDAAGAEVDNAHGLAVARGMIDLVDRVEASGREAFVIGPIQIPGEELASTLPRQLAFGEIDLSAAGAQLESPRGRFDAAYAPALDLLSARLSGRLITPHDMLCGPEMCLFGTMDGFYFSDSNHLGHDGAARLAPLFSQALAPP